MRQREKRILEQIKTTVKEGRTIYLRNKRLLFALWDDKVKYYTGYIGCPHCKGSCASVGGKECAYYVLKGHGKGMRCSEVKFNGMKLRDFQGRGYFAFYSTEEYIDVDNMPGEETKKELEKFLLGHIEWAFYCITREWLKGGTRSIRKIMKMSFERYLKVGEGIDSVK